MDWKTKFVKATQEDMKEVANSQKAAEIAKKIGIDWAKVDFDLKQFTIGINMEWKEHGTDDETIVVRDLIGASKIAWAHLKEIPDYYTRLQKMESNAEAEVEEENTAKDTTAKKSDKEVEIEVEVDEE